MSSQPSSPVKETRIATQSMPATVIRRERKKGNAAFERSASVSGASRSRARGPATLKPQTASVRLSTVVPAGRGTSAKNRW